MDARTFDMELRRYLKKRLPQNTGYEWSRRIEGAIVRSEGNGAFEKVLILVDSELPEIQIKALFEQVLDSFHKESILRKSRFNYVIWNKDGLDDKSIRIKSSFFQMPYFKDVFEKMSFINEITGDWETLEKLYAPYRSLAQVMIFTTEEKVNMLDTSYFSYTKNSMVIYPSIDEKSNAELHRNELCLGLNVPMAANDIDKERE